MTWPLQRLHQISRERVLPTPRRKEVLGLHHLAEAVHLRAEAVQAVGLPVFLACYAHCSRAKKSKGGAKGEGGGKGGSSGGAGKASEQELEQVLREAACKLAYGGRAVILLLASHVLTRVLPRVAPSLVS